jgi:hypothetical protein
VALPVAYVPFLHGTGVLSRAAHAKPGGHSLQSVPGTLHMPWGHCWGTMVPGAEH